MNYFIMQNEFCELNCTDLFIQDALDEIGKKDTMDWPKPPRNLNYSTYSEED
jgi:hypothetical protein